MDARLQRRVQRYGWDLAARDYETLWQAQLADAQTALLAAAALATGEQVLDVACGTGLVTFEAARAVGQSGRVLGIDLSGGMVEAARQRASSSDSSRLFDRRERSERREFSDVATSARSQGSRSEAQAAPAKRGSRPGRAFAAPT